MNASVALVDEERLSNYLDTRLPGDGGFAVERHRAGHSNETFFVRRSGHEWVLRRPPAGAFLPTAHDVAREYRVLSALMGTAARVPRTVLMCEDEGVIGAPFYVMEAIDGFVIRTEIPPTFGESARAGVGTELVDALVELHRVDYESCGLAGFGKPSGYLERQLRRWAGQLELTIPHTRPLHDLQRVGGWLATNIPTSQATTLVHGDFKLDNVVYAPAPPARLVAILDWEMSTLGDPLADLGWMVTFWREAGDRDDDGPSSDLNRVTELPGFSSRAELIERYARATGFDVDGLAWYQVLAVYKVAILLEGSYARHLAGATDDPFFGRLEEGVPALARRALAIAGL